MDPREVSLFSTRLTLRETGARAWRLGPGRACLLAASAALLAGTAGCRSRPIRPSSNLTDAIKKEAGLGKGKESPTMTLSGMGNKFQISDEHGKPVLDAKVGKMDGTVQPGQGPITPVKMLQAQCLLYQKGAPQMDFKTPEATWHEEQKQLVTDKTAHAVSADKKTIFDAQKAVWASQTGRLDLEQAKVQGMKQGKTDFTAEGPKAIVQGPLVTMNSGASCRNQGGQQLKADRMRWHRDTGRLEADGNVMITENGTWVTGDSLVSDTKLKRGKLKGKVQIRLQRQALAKNKG